MTGFLDDSRIELTCPKCGHKFKERLGKLKTEPTLTCGGCGTHIAIDAKKLTPGLNQVDKSIADLKKALGRIGKVR